MKYAITVNGLTKKFQNKKALNNVGFFVREGEIFGFLGPSGSGKTTAINILTNQLYQDEGKISILGKDIAEYGAELYKIIGIMGENYGLYERISVYENLYFFAKIHGKSKNDVLRVLEQVRLNRERKTFVNKLSKGMKQRLVLARVLIQNPKILFLDEPTSALDPMTKKVIHNILKMLKIQGTSIFLTTHDMKEAEELCDRIALLNHGEIIEEGSLKDICIKHNVDKKFMVTDIKGRTQYFENTEQGINQLKKMLDMSSVETIHSNEPSLEEVFIKLTGRNLDEY